MRIAQVSPLYESVPPRSYGGTERVVSYLTEELVRQGHEVTLYASGDSVTSARLVAGCAGGLRLHGSPPDPVVAHLLLVEEVLAHRHDHDVVHFHIEPFHFPLVRREPGLHSITTLHGRLDYPELVAFHGRYNDVPVVSISDAQRAPVPELAWRATVHHGLPPDLLRLGAGRGGYLAFLGRISPEKGPGRAIEIARRTGIPLRIAAKIDRADQAYYEAKIRPLIDGRHITFVGEVAEREKQAFLGDALALLCPIDWPEPFGLVMIEAFACGTPVVAFPSGSVPEVMTEGVTGFVVDSIEAAIDAVERIASIDRAGVRRVFEERFTVSRMAERYVGLYHRIREGGGKDRAAA